MSSKVPILCSYLTYHTLYEVLYIYIYYTGRTRWKPSTSVRAVRNKTRLIGILKLSDNKRVSHILYDQVYIYFCIIIILLYFYL